VKEERAASGDTRIDDEILDRALLLDRFHDDVNVSVFDVEGNAARFGGRGGTEEK